MSNRGVTPYRERLWPAPWLYISTALVIPASMLVFFPISPIAGVVVAIVLYVGCVALLLAGSPRLEVTATDFIAGKARIPLELVGEVTGYRADEARLERGPRLDARAWLLIRGWIDPVIKVPVNDPADPVPYWIVSTRRPDSIIEAIVRAQTTLRTPGK